MSWGGDTLVEGVEHAKGEVGDVIIPEISGRGWITGIHQYKLNPSGSWRQGYRLSDT